MQGHLSSLTGHPSSSLPPRILLAEDNLTMLESLDSVCNRMREVDFHVCTSRDHALWKLMAEPYKVIISGIHLAEMDDFFLVKQNQALQLSVPLIVTAKASDKASVRKALEQGAFDVITHPFNSVQALVTIRRGLWLNKLFNLIATKEKAMERYRRHLSHYPANSEMKEVFKRTIVAFEKSIFTYKQTMERLEGSLSCFTGIALQVEKETRERALQRLNAPFG